MSNNWIFNEPINKTTSDKFIINKGKIMKIKEPSDMQIDYNVFFTGMLNINNFKDLDKELKENKYDYNFKKYIFINYLIYKESEIEKNKGLIANIIYDNFNIENKEISYIYKSLKKNIINTILEMYLL